MAKVAVVMGSKSDMPTLQHCLDMLDEFGIEYYGDKLAPVEKR